MAQTPMAEYLKRLLKQFLILLGVASFIGAGAMAWYLWPRRQLVFTDADQIRAAQDAAPVREILWTPPTPLAERLNTSADDYEPVLSADGLTLFFVRGKAGQNADIYFCARTPSGWTEPEPLAVVNTEYDELGPEITADGASLYFYSNRTGSIGGYDLWVSRLGDKGWRPAANLGPNVNSPFNDYGPALLPDGKSLYFSSNRPRPDETVRPVPEVWPATLREKRRDHDYDLYLCVLTDSGPAQAAPLIALNTPFDEGAPAVSPFGDFLYFSSDRPEGLGGIDLYRSRRLRGGHDRAENLGPALNTAANELDPDLSLGGYALHFSSDRPRTDDATARAGQYDLYYTTSREVFREVETTQASINWAGLWDQLGPNLLLALLALLLILLLLALLRDFRERRLGLLARCLLASLLAHLLLMLLFNVMEVTATLANVVRGKGKIQVALLSAAAGNEIADQIRGGLTEFDTPTPVEPALEPMDSTEMLEFDDPASDFEMATASVTFVESPTVEQIVEDSPAPSVEADMIREIDSETEPVEAVSAIEVATPTESAMVDAAEADAPVRPDAIAASSVRMSSARLPTTQPAMPTSDFSLEPESSVATTIEKVSTALAASGSVHDAVPGDGARRAETAPIAEAMASPELRLETPGEAPAVDSSEVGAPNLPRTAPTNSIKAESTPPVTDGEQFAAAFELAPQPADLSALDGRPAERTGADSISEADPRDRPSQDHAPDRRAVTSATHSDFHVPTDAGHPASETAESAPVVSAAKTESLRSSAETTSAAIDPRTIETTLASIMPAASDGAFSESSVVEESTATKSDALPNKVRTTTRLDRQADVPLPSLLAVALPSDESPGAERAIEAERDAASAMLVAEADRERSGLIVRLEDSTEAQDAYYVTVPVAIEKNAESVIAESISPEDADLGMEDRKTAAPPTGLAAISEPMELELGIPIEIEPPPELQPASDDTIGVIHGRVTDAETGEPLPDVMVRLVLPSNDTVIAMTDEDGLYRLDVPPAPDFFALSASLEGHVPETLNIPAEELTTRGMLDVDFELRPMSEFVIPIEEDPDVHHLGNDRFTGRINSQFQRPSEGKRFRAKFEITEAQLQAEYSYAEIWLLAKGVQCPHPIRLNGRLLKERLDVSPRDGSFGEFSVEFDPKRLIPGTNRIKITAKACRGDLDDFEFVNVQIRLVP